MATPPQRSKTVATNKGKAATSSSTSKTPKPAATPNKGTDSTGGKEQTETQRNPHGWPTVEILWIDAVADGLTEWLDPEQLTDMKPENSRVVGYLAHQTPEHITITSLINENSVAHTLCIPRTLITELKYLEGP
jgi:hypothetical protein